MRRITIILATIALAACASPTGDTPITTNQAQQAPPADAIDVTITGVDLSSDGVTIRGEAPTPCNDLGSTISTEGDGIEIQVWAEPLDEGETCAQVIEPFEMTLEFESPEIETPVTVNDVDVGRVGG